ncbi:MULTISPECIES: hypothetical protein [Pannonibacter]|uniref:Uncharacterized protein n=1 Tax=Pannonibacter phragmitetus TaxID=121719 RepID=A0A0U3PSH4_9HYPH|nr:hypothetical protein [Pannonibacter phragmitetus]ALV30269.1 hypothetical protein APZ00_20290 [Pannonibacter phragmitetus]
MWDFSLTGAFALMARTAPFLLFRMAVYFGMACAYVIATGTGAAIGYGAGQLGDEDFLASSTALGGIAGFGLVAAVLYLLREYVLYIVKAGHIAVLVELMDGRPLPEGEGQVAYGSRMVRERFAQASLLFGIDQLVKGVISAIAGLIEGIASLLPIPGLQAAAGLLRNFLKVAIGFTDEVILAHAMRTRAANPWASAEEALVLYGQNYRTMFRNAAWLAVMIYGLSFLVFLLALAPAAALVYLMPGALSAGGLVFAVLFAWAFKAALLEPLAITCMMQVFFRTTEGQVPDPAWRARLQDLSGKFREIGGKARDWASGRAGAARSTAASA